MNNILRLKQHHEATNRLRKMKMTNFCFVKFKLGCNVSLSKFYGYISDLPEDIKSVVQSFENDNEALVYHVLESHSNFGKIYNLLFVSNNENNWKHEFSVNDKPHQYYALSQLVFIDDTKRNRVELISIRYSNKKFKFSHIVQRPKSILVSIKPKQPVF